MPALACVAGGIVRVRGKILTAESEYGRSREENGKESLTIWLVFAIASCFVPQMI